MTASVPRPESLITFDRTRREINSPIAVIGSSAVEFLRHLHEKTSGDRKKIDASTPGEASYHYLTLRLGDLRGFATCFHLYAFDGDERLQPMIEEIIPHARGLIIVSSRDALEANARAAAEHVARLQRRLPAAVLASDSSRAEWSRRAGAPAFEASWSTEEVFPTLKVVAKEILTQLRDGEGPAPRAAPAPQKPPEKPWWKFW